MSGLNDKNQIDEKTQNVNVGGHKELIAEGENAFGGANPAGLYVPMSEDEQEVLHRLAESGDLQLVVGEWGTIDRPKLIVGDHRVRIDFAVTFKGLYVARNIHFLDLELKLNNGMSVYKARLPTYVGGLPLEIYEGLRLPMQWDIAIKHMDPDFVRAIKPGATGLTSRRQDKDTREMTDEGNMRLDTGRKKLLRDLEQGQAAVRALDTQVALKASVAGGDKVVKTAAGIEYLPKR